MKITKYIMLLAAAAGFSASCQKLEMVQVVDPSQAVAPVLEEVAPITVTEESLAKPDTIKLSWSAADYGAPTEIDYALELAVGGGDKTVIKSGIHATDMELLHPEANNAFLFKLNLKPNVESEVEFYISAKLAGTAKVYSTPVIVKVTPLLVEREYKKIYVIGSFNGWADGTTQELFDFADNDTEYSGMIGFGGKAGEGFKVRGSEIDWINDLGNWGLDGDAPVPDKESAEIPLKNDGGSANISVYEKDFYNFTLVKADPSMKVNFSFNTLGVFGDAAAATGEDKDMKFSTTKQLFWLDVELTEGTLKFRADDADDLVWGVKATGDATKRAVLDGKEAVKVPAGNYRIYLDLNNPAEPSFRLSADDYGAADPDPDVPVEPEPEKPEPVEAWSILGSMTEWDKNEIIMTNANGIWMTEDIEFAEGAEFKIRWKQSWEAPNPNYGMAEGVKMIKVGEENKLVQGGANIKLDKAGTFSVLFNPETETIKVFEKGTEPVPVLSEWGIVGSITEWGNTGIKDLALVQEGDYFVHKGLVLKDTDQVKFRKNGEWPPKGQDATSSNAAPDVELPLASGPANMKFPAGTYDVYINADCTKAWFMTEGKTPADAGEPLPPPPEPVVKTWGFVGSPTGWAEGKDLQMVEKDGQWILYGIDLTTADIFKFRANGDFNLAQFGAKSDAALVVDVETELSTDGGSGNLKVAADGKYDLYLNVEKGTLTVKTAVEGPIYSDWGIVGTVNNWAAPDLKLEKEGDYFVHKGLVLKDTDEVKFRKNGQFPPEGQDATSPNAAPDVELALASGPANMKFPAGTYDVYINADCTKAWFMTEGKTPADATKPEPVEPEQNVSPWGIVGTVNNWAAPDLKLEKEGDYFVHKGLVLKDTDEVKFRKNGQFPPEGQDATSPNAAPDVELALASGPANMKFPAGTYDVYINADCTKAWFMTEGKTPADATTPVEPDPQPAEDTWAICGEFNNWADTPMSKDGNVCTVSGVELKAGQKFKFRANGTWDKQFCAKDDTPLNTGMSFLVQKGTDITMSADGTYKFVLDVSSGRLMIF